MLTLLARGSAIASLFHFLAFGRLGFLFGLFLLWILNNLKTQERSTVKGTAAGDRKKCDGMEMYRKVDYNMCFMC